MNKKRGGPFSAEEKQYIIDNVDKKPYTEIAKDLGRNEKAVKRIIEDLVGKKIVSGTSKWGTSHDIKKSVIWKELQEEFSDKELELFLFHWARIINQFKDDVFPTEELQIVDMIKIEILMGRILKHQQSCLTSISNLEKEIVQEQKLGENKDVKRIDELEHSVIQYRGALEAFGKEYSDFQGKKDTMLKSLKATRAERIKRIEDSKETLIGWVSELLRDSLLRKRLGENMEKMRLAIEIEKLRLFEPHTYVDKTVDIPFLSSDTYKYIEEKEKQQEQNLN